MKVLKRKEGETVTEADDIPGIDWNTGMPLTCPEWAGGPYILVNDCVTKDPVDPTPADSLAQDLPADTIVIDGKKYNKEELRSLLK